MEQEILQRHLAKFIASEIFNTITEDSIIREVGGVLHHKGQPLAPGMAELYRKEAVAFAKTGLFQLLQDEMQWYARDSLNKAKTETDMINAKLLSYFCDVFRSKVKKLAELKPQ